MVVAAAFSLSCPGAIMAAFRIESCTLYILRGLICTALHVITAAYSEVVYMSCYHNISCTHIFGSKLVSLFKAVNTEHVLCPE
jgi:hypothetical protein